MSPQTLTPFFTTIPCDTETPVSLYARLSHGASHSFLLESAEPNDRFGRYSLIGIEPLVSFAPKPEESPFAEMQKLLDSLSYTPSPELPRIQAPLVGYFSYESVKHLEKIATRPKSDNEIPECNFFLPRFLVIMDHLEHTATAIAYNEPDLKEITERINRENKNNLAPLTPNTSEKIEPKENTTPFIQQVEEAKEQIRSGEAFQIVLSQKFEAKTTQSPLELYRRLRLTSPSPYMYLLNFSDFSIIGSSPETLVRTETDTIITRPIAGTRRRGRTKEEDESLSRELLSDPKELAEHAMLVDLGRNDLGRVAKSGTVKVTKHMELVKYSHVMHLVSELHGARKPDMPLVDILTSHFPAGTLTGAPKVRAMEIISKMEDSPREIYGGAVGYFDLSGDMDFAIAIRTMIHQDDSIRMRAGAGIVYDSQAELEDLECRNKARAPLSTVITSI